MSTILVVDDHEEIRSLLYALLSGTFEVTTAENGTVALEHIAKKTFDAIVLDLEMPGLDGVGVMRAIRAHDVACPVLLCSGHPELAHRARTIGASDYIAKPFCSRVLKAKLEALIRNAPRELRLQSEPVSRVRTAASGSSRRHSRA